MPTGEFGIAERKAGEIFFSEDISGQTRKIVYSIHGKNGNSVKEFF